LLYLHLRQLCYCGVILLLGSLCAQAQSPSPQESSASQQQSSSDRSWIGDEAQIQREPVDLILSFDEKGKPRLGAAGITLAEVEKAKRLLAGRLGEPEKPQFTIDQLHIQGRAANGLAQLSAELTIKLHTDRLVRIPLGLNEAVLSRRTYTGAGKQFLTFDPKRDGYVLWLKGEAGSEHLLRLELLATVATSGDERVLRLIAPRAEGPSSLQLEVDVANAVGHLADDDALLESTELASGVTKFVAKRVRPEFQLAWRSPDRQRATIPPQLSVNGEIRVRLDGTSALSTARLQVKSAGGGFERFRVRLPQDAQLISEPQTGYNLQPIGKGKGGQLIEVQFEEEQTGAV